ncbi:MAG TPA: hypothetical protein VG847_15715 [Chitinophagaceae bacterium]|nr:hypothetical protein [Chitinophagaceae bacterium]
MDLKMSVLYSYKMTNDSGFAPNPFHGIMTLANCKPQIRNNQQLINAINEGVFVAGFTSKELYDRIGKKITNPELVFIMRVTEILPYEKYGGDSRFQCKKPPELINLEKEHGAVKYIGDNIYEPVRKGDFYYFIHHDNISHPCHYRKSKALVQFGDCKWQPCCHQNFEIMNSDTSVENYNLYRKYSNENGSLQKFRIVLLNKWPI